MHAFVNCIVLIARVQNFHAQRLRVCCNNLYLARQISYYREIIRKHVAWKCLPTENVIKCAQIAQSILLWHTDIVRVYSRAGTELHRSSLHVDLTKGSLSDDR